jgi:hypothetical protein
MDFSVLYLEQRDFVSGHRCHIVESNQGRSKFADEKRKRRILDKIFISRCMDLRNIVPFQRIAWLIDVISQKERNDDSVI